MNRPTVTLKLRLEVGGVATEGEVSMEADNSQELVEHLDDLFQAVQRAVRQTEDDEEPLDLGEPWQLKLPPVSHYPIQNPQFSGQVTEDDC